MSVCQGCGVPIPQQRLGRPRKWCSRRCQKITLYRKSCLDCGTTIDGHPDGRKHVSLRCKSCAVKARTRWTRETIVSAIERWVVETGRPPSVSDWNATQARAAGRPARSPDYPPASTVQNVFGSWSNAIEAAGFDYRPFDRRRKVTA